MKTDRTVREMVRDAQIEVRDSDLLPQRAAELLGILTALLGNVNRELREAEMAYNGVLRGCLAQHEAANRARIEAEGTSEYLRKREAKDTLSEVTEMIRSLKIILKSQQEEMRLAR